MKIHEYRCELSWAGSTGKGYRAYDRTHQVRMPPAKAELDMASDPSFLGDPALPNPEQLLTAAATSCHMLSFLALAAREGLDVVAYRDEALGRMPVSSQSMETILLKPRVTIAGAVEEGQFRRLMHEAHETCFIARSLRSEITVEPELEVLPARS
ncbi:MAG TPA: OsmC family protein [Acidimicrobiales bacterium]|nr:OsmC family protein [Acidimicrobiales bacterium]